MKKFIYYEVIANCGKQKSCGKYKNLKLAKNELNRRFDNYHGYELIKIYKISLEENKENGTISQKKVVVFEKTIEDIWKENEKKLKKGDIYLMLKNGKTIKVKRVSSRYYYYKRNNLILLEAYNYFSEYNKVE